jgi:hypothetical protein
VLTHLLGSLAAKITAGVLGTALAVGGLGAAGGLPEPARAALDKVGDVAGITVTGTDTEDDTGGSEDSTENSRLEHAFVDEDETDGADGTDGTDGTNGATSGVSPVPTSTSEAAHVHDFDEACGNHGAYVSHFARTGEEPECATNARAGQPTGSATTGDGADTDDDADDEGSEEDDDAVKADNKAAKSGGKAAGHGGKPGQQRAKSAGKGGKGSK